MHPHIPYCSRNTNSNQSSHRGRSSRILSHEAIHSIEATIRNSDLVFPNISFLLGGNPIGLPFYIVRDLYFVTSGYFLFLGRALHFIASRMRRYISVLFLGSLSPACFYFFRRSVPYGISILKVQGRQSALPCFL